jgi:cell division septum initiation protein DivIVA
MFLRAGSGRAASNEGRASDDGGPELPNLRGDLTEVLDHRPVFSSRVHGYDRLEVDNYTAWVEGELLAVRREVDHVLRRFGECSAELEISRRMLADVPRGRPAFPVSERIEEMLRLAADEAAAITEAGAQEADRLTAEARAEADARLRKAAQIKEAAVRAADELLQQARRDRAEAAATVAAAADRARAEAAEILRVAAAERERLAALATRKREEAAAAESARLATVRAEVDVLHRQRDQARQALRGLTERIGEALQAVAAVEPDDMTGTNVAVEGITSDDRDVVMAGRPSPVPG